MKKTLVFLISILSIFILTACNINTISEKRYNEISSYVLDNIDTLSSEKEKEFFDYETDGISVGGVYYGYYYTANDEIVLPDFYNGNDIEQIKNSKYQADGGTYFGQPNDGTDWCFIKKITDNWYYYELHWA